MLVLYLVLFQGFTLCRKSEAKKTHGKVGGLGVVEDVGGKKSVDARLSYVTFTKLECYVITVRVERVPVSQICASAETKNQKRPW